jgi:IS30 family transposase
MKKPILTVEQRHRVRKLRREGLLLRDVAREVGCSLPTVLRVIKGPSRRETLLTWEPGRLRLSLAEREEISLGLGRGESFAAMGSRLDRSTSTVSREVAANGGRDHYRAWRSHERAHTQARRPKKTKMAGCPALAAQVEAWLVELWSPQEINRRLRIEFPDDPMMRVSHETIYQALFVQGRGELRRELQRCLRSGRTERLPRHRLHHRGKIPDMVMISKRPAEADDRAVPGHWEGDLIIGKNGGSAVGTLVERTTRYVLLLHLPHGREADQVTKAMKKAIATLPGELFRTITWDQGVEMSRHAQFSIDTGVQVYFCDPHSPWQRGSNENTNGLLRQYMPKGTDLSLLSAKDLARIARSLNNRPRQTLGFMKPSEKLAEVLALTG